MNNDDYIEILKGREIINSELRKLSLMKVEIMPYLDIPDFKKKYLSICELYDELRVIDNKYHDIEF